MNRLKVGAMVFCWALAGLVFTTEVKAQLEGWSKTTKMTFSAPFEIPGVGAQVLPAGTYIFTLLDHQSDRHIVQIWNTRRDHVYSTILAIPNYRLHPTDKTVMTFRERAAGQPQAIRAWFYPGNQWGQEFVYPKSRAIEIAKQTNEPVLAMSDDLAAMLVKPINSADEPPVKALIEAPIEAVKPTGEVVAMSEVVEAPPAEMAEPSTSTSPAQIAEATPKSLHKSLPKTASSMPLLGLFGLLSITIGLGLAGISKRLF